MEITFEKCSKTLLRRASHQTNGDSHDDSHHSVVLTSSTGALGHIYSKLSWIVSRFQQLLPKSLSQRVNEVSKGESVARIGYRMRQPAGEVPHK